MANWTGVITNGGNRLLNEWVNEKILHFDHAAAGEGTVPEAGLMAQTTLTNQKQLASIIGGQRVDSGIRLKIQLAASETEYQLNQYGIWASVTGESSVLIALFQNEQGIPIPDKSEFPDFVYTFYALISTSNTGTWKVSVDTSTMITMDTAMDFFIPLEEKGTPGGVATLSQTGVLNNTQIPDIDCGIWDSDPIAEHNTAATAHQNLTVDGNNTAAVDSSQTLEEHMANPNAHQNLIVDGNNT